MYPAKLFTIHKALFASKSIKKADDQEMCDKFYSLFMLISNC